MSQLTPIQGIFFYGQLSMNVFFGTWFGRTAFFPKPTDNLTRRRRLIHGIGAVLFGIDLLLHILYWPGR